MLVRKAVVSEISTSNFEPFYGVCMSVLAPFFKVPEVVVLTPRNWR